MGRLAQVVLVAVLAAAVVVGAIVLSSNEGDDETPAESSSEVSVADEVAALYEDVPQKGIRLGDTGAPATLVEIADLQCPFCAQYSLEAMPSIVRDYVRTGKLVYELHIRSFLGRDSVRAAGAAAEAANQNRMYEFADVFFRNQGPENSGYADADFIRMVASQVEGLDIDKVVAAADDPLAQPQVRRAELYARRIGSTSTPDLYIRRKGQMTRLEPQGTTPEAYAAAIDAVLGS